MMGRAGVGEEGIIPRLCKDLFDKISLDDDPDVQYSVEVIKICFFNLYIVHEKIVIVMMMQTICNISMNLFIYKA